MCGFLGIIHYDRNAVTRSRFTDALDRMEHRGPDGSGVFQDDAVLLGHRRLSIIDLSEHANQPFHSSDDRVIIVFNGEIYNYREISSDLPLRTSSDTEVLLQGYIREGTSFFKKIRGIYAFTIYDRREGESFIMCRDPGGVKPFYYTRDANGFIFASEIKSILPLKQNKPGINRESIKQYIHLGYCPEPNTAYNDIFALEPGCCYRYNPGDGSLTKEILIQYDFRDIAISHEEALKQTEKLLKTACHRNMVADVRVNIALSGGIDSSLVYAYSNEGVETGVCGITIKFDEKEYDESEVAAAYARHIGAPHQIETTSVDQRFDLLNTLLLHFDQPYADSSFIPFFFLCQAATKHSKVLIGGDSGDEIHNGYAGHRILPFMNRIRRSPARYPAIWTLSLLSVFLKGEKKRFARKLSGLFRTKDLKSLIFYWESWFPPDKGMYPSNPFRYDPLSVDKQVIGGSDEDVIEHSYFYGRMLSDYLRKSDMMSMINSLEFRVPMLDEDLTAYSLQIPYSLKSDRKHSKKLLRELHSTLFPAEFSKLKKKGFTIPLDTWLGHENLRKIRDYIMERNGIVKEFIEPDYVESLFNAVGNNTQNAYISRASAYQRILILYSLELWYQNTIV